MNQKLNNRTVTTVAAFFLALFWIGLSSLHARAQEFNVLKSYGGDRDIFISGPKVDDHQNLYAIGNYFGAITLGSTTLTSRGSSDVFFAKFDSQGNLVWARSIGGAEQDQGAMIAVDGSGNSYVTGLFMGTFSIGSVTLHNDDEWTEGYVAKYDTNGNLLWAKHIDGVDSYAYASAIATDGQGNAYVTGSFDATMKIGSETLTSAGGFYGFLAKFDTNGNLGWIKVGVSKLVGNWGEPVYHDGKIYFTGEIDEKATFENTTLTSAGGRDIFVAVYDVNGTFLWARRAGGPMYDAAANVAVDSWGNVFVTGIFAGRADFGSFVLTSVPEIDHDAFLAKYDSSGTLLWARSFGGSRTDAVYDVKLDGNDNVYVLGYSGRGDLLFDSIKLPDQGRGIFIARYDNDGHVSWVTQATSLDPISIGLGHGSDGSFYMTAGYKSSVNFGSFTLNASGQSSKFFVGHFILDQADDLIFADGFEGGNFSAWTNYSSDFGDLSVTPAAAMVGHLGLNLVLDDNTPIGTHDEVPNRESLYRARFYFDPNSIAIASGESHVIFFGYSGADLTRPVLRLEFGYLEGSYQFRAALVNDATVWRVSGWKPISDSPHLVELSWRASTSAGANSGGLNLWIDESLQSNIANMDNDTRHIDTTRLGAIAGIDSGTRGAYYIDAFEARRLNYIGAATDVTAAMVTPISASDVNEIESWTDRDESEPDEAALRQEVLEYARQDAAQNEGQSPHLFLPWMGH